MTQNFIIRASVDPQTLPRVVGQLARQWITPETFEATQKGDTFIIAFTIKDLPEDKAMILAATLRSNVLVDDVEIRFLALPNAQYAEQSPHFQELMGANGA